MFIFLVGRSPSYFEFIAILVIFVLVLGVTAFTTKWIAQYQKQQGINGNIELLDAVRLNGNKYVQIIRVGETYFAVAVCKDTVTVLGEIPAEQVKLSDEKGTQSFQNLFGDALNKVQNSTKFPKEKKNDEDIYKE